MSLYPFPSSAIFNAPFTLKPLPSPIPLELILKPPEKFSTANAYDGRLKISDQSFSASIGTDIQKKEEMDIKLLIRNAEQHMYDDKRRYYETSGKDRRRDNSDELEEMIRIVNHSEIPEAIYCFRDGRVCTVCVSDGLYDMMHCEDEPDKASLIARYDRNMYRMTLPQDAARIAAEALRFAKEAPKTYHT